MRIRDEAHFHTAEQVETYATEAVRLADAIGLEGEDRAAILPTLVELLSAKQVVMDAGASMGVALPTIRQ